MEKNNWDIADYFFMIIFLGVTQFVSFDYILNSDLMKGTKYSIYILLILFSLTSPYIVIRYFFKKESD